MSSASNQNASSAADILSKFESMMSSLVTANDAAARSEAEKQLLELKNTNLLLYLECLLQLMLRSSQSDVKQLCMVMFRRSCEPNNTSKEEWQQIPETAYSAFQTALLSALRNEAELTTYLLVCDAVGTLASRLIPDGKWNNLLAQLLDLVNATAASSFHKQGFLRVLDCLAEYVISHIQAQFGNIYKVIEAALHDQSTDIAVAAYKAYVSMVISMDDDTATLQPWQPLIATCLQLLSIEREDVLCKVLATTIDLVSHRLSSLFTEKDINALLTSVFKIAGNDKLEFETRKLAFEMLVVMATRNAALLRTHQQFITNVVQLCLHFLALFDDDIDFADSESDMDQLYVWNGRQWLAQLTKSLGAKAVLLESQSMLQNGLQSVDTNWKRCYATLTALTEIVPFLKERSNESDLKAWQLTSSSSSSSSCIWHELVPQIMRFTIDKQLKTAPIKFAALELVKTLLIEFAASFRQRFHVDFYRSIMQIVSEYKSYHPRVLEECVKCVAHFHRTDLTHSDDDDDDGSNSAVNDRGLLMQNLLAFASQILGALQRMIGDDALNEGLRAQCATCIGTLAECMQDKFLPFYEKFMPVMMRVIEQENTKAIFRGKALECIGMMGEAVGRVRFARDVDKLMPWLLALRTRLKAREETNAADNVAYNYVNQLFARISRCMRDAFIPYLPQVMTMILQSARMEAANVLKPEQVSPTDARFSVFTVHVRGVGDVKFCINPISLEEKQTACHMLYQLAKDQCVAFAPFVLETAHCMKELMRYQYNARIRAAATTSMPLLLKSVIKAIGAQTIAPDQQGKYHALLAELFEPFVVALQFEPDVTEQIPILEILAQMSSVIQQSGGFWTWSDAQLQRIASVLAQILSESQERCQQRKAALAKDEADEDLEWANEVDAELTAHVIDVIEYTYKVSGERFTKFLHHSADEKQNKNENENEAATTTSVVQVAQRMLQSTENLHRLHALCIFVDIIEYGGKLAADLYLKWLWPIVCELVTDNDTDLQQTAIYAIGMLAQRTYLQHLDADYEWLHCFVRQVVKTQCDQNNAADNGDDDDDYDEDELLLFENKLSAIGKILRYQPPTKMASETLSEILQQWIQLLPIENDEEEIDNVTDNLLFFVTQFWTLLVEKNADLRQHVVYCCLYCCALFKQRLTSYELIMDYDIDFKTNGKSQKIPVLSTANIQKIKQLKQHKLLQPVFESVLTKLTPQQRQNIQFVFTKY
eukprot:CAMPEP_0202701330 /NCGR_PEP_ID=MMETSP1385-20130828/14429_1 /ASSEMBLY_ACC=CAM_ASM_000861 /TAXON_ID=933848 /ORGANISM="Elphidium margaritaceum" /LENGTH=1221 /DNA_ID=CAMNT_0049358723 /DNA_START=20 /DNA_END=3685 /DNA_ORIENTATION=-